MKICACCFNDEEIKQFIITSSTNKMDCPYCDNHSECIDIDELLDFWEEFFSVFTKNETGTPLIEFIQKDWNLFSTATNYQKILTEILCILNIKLSTTDKVTYISEINDYVGYWDVLKENLKWNKRFLSNIDHLFEHEWSEPFKIYSEIDKNKKLYRARIHTDGATTPFGLNSMGAPPKEKTIGGRANPLGIPYLYLCNDMDTTLYETRVSYLDVVSIGTFQLKDVDKIKIVDFTKWQSPFSNDAPNMITFVKDELLRQRISHDLSKPMRSFDSELEYIPTQFICEFVRFQIDVDGIQFNSSLNKNGLNVVLFSPDKVQCVDEQIHQITEIEIKSMKIK